MARRALAGEDLLASGIGIEGHPGETRQVGEERARGRERGDPGTARWRHRAPSGVGGRSGGTPHPKLCPARADGIYTVPADVDPGEFPIVDVSVEPPDGDPTHSGVSLARGELA